MELSFMDVMTIIGMSMNILFIPLGKMLIDQRDRILTLELQGATKDHVKKNYVDMLSYQKDMKNLENRHTAAVEEIRDRLTEMLEVISREKGKS